MHRAERTLRLDRTTRVRRTALLVLPPPLLVLPPPLLRLVGGRVRSRVRRCNGRWIAQLVLTGGVACTVAGDAVAARNASDAII